MKKLLSLLFLVSFGFLSAQSFIGLYNFNHVNQNLLVNPASPHNYKFVIALPGIGGLHTHTNLNNLGAEFLEPGADINQELADAINSLKVEDRINQYQTLDGIFVGFSSGRGYWTVAAQQVAELNMNIPSNLLKFAYFGNVGSGNLGKTVNLGFGIDFNVRNEYSIGYQHYIDSNLIIGGRYKYISGVANGFTENHDINVTSDVDKLTMDVNYLIKSSNINTIGDDLSDPVSFYSGSLFSRNAGMGFDLGAYYRINEHFDVSASILNLGWITWRNNTHSYQAKGTFEFEGVGIDYDLMQDPDFDFGELFGGYFSDSLVDQINLDTVPISQYTTPLASHFIVSGQYHLTPKHVFGLLYQGSNWDNRLYHNYGIMYNGRYSKWFNLMVGYSVIDNARNNVTLGLSLRLGVFQIYALTDNTFGLLEPSSIRATNVRAGITLSFIDKPKKEKNKTEENKTDK